MMYRRLIRCAVFVPLVLHAMLGQACRVSAAGQSIGGDEQIPQATQVAVGQVVSATPVDRYDEASGADAASLPQTFEGKYERIGKFIYGFHRIIARTDLDRKSLAARHAPPELLLRAGSLADAFDHILADNTVPDAEIEATLREAVSVKKMLAALPDVSFDPARLAEP